MGALGPRQEVVNLGGAPDPEGLLWKGQCSVWAHGQRCGPSSRPKAALCPVDLAPAPLFHALPSVPSAKGPGGCHTSQCPCNGPANHGPDWDHLQPCSPEVCLAQGPSRNHARPSPGNGPTARTSPQTMPQPCTPAAPPAPRLQAPGRRGQSVKTRRCLFFQMGAHQPKAVKVPESQANMAPPKALIKLWQLTLKEWTFVNHLTTNPE